MRGHKVCFIEKLEKISLKYLQYSLLAGALIITSATCVYLVGWLVLGLTVL